MKIKQHLFGISALAAVLAFPALAEEKTVIKNKQCEITIEDGKVTTKGDCDTANIKEFEDGNFSGKKIMKFITSNEVGGGPNAFILRSGSFPGAMQSFSIGGENLSNLLMDFNQHINMDWDSNQDGEVSAEEIKTAKKVELAKYDKNRNRSLNLDEFENLWMAKQRNRMVDQFQDLDENGDGKITEQELADSANKHRSRKIKIKRVMKHHFEEN